MSKPISAMRGDMYDLAAKIERDAQEHHNETVSYIGQNLIPDTPVDTGKARQNWFISYDAPSSFEFPYPGPPGRGFELLGRQVQNFRSISRAITSWTTFVVNNAPYIIRLNQGYSAQAGSGYIEEAISNAAGQAERIPLIK